VKREELRLEEILLRGWIDGVRMEYLGFRVERKGREGVGGRWIILFAIGAPLCCI
jgi:hypothetical protein